MLQCSMKLSMRLQFLTLFLLQCAKIRHSTDIPWCFDYAMAQCLPCDLGHHRAFPILQPGPVDLQRDAAKAVARAINQGGERPMKRFVRGFVVFGCLLCSMLGADTAVAQKSGGILKLKVQAAAQALVTQRLLIEEPGIVQDIETYTTPAMSVTIPANP
jgi:hypothetical protein